MAMTRDLMKRKSVFLKNIVLINMGFLIAPPDWHRDTLYRNDNEKMEEFNLIHEIRIFY